jgi:uncharacterized repeat protein (TIGR01451 family)
MQRSLSSLLRFTMIFIGIVLLIGTSAVLAAPTSEQPYQPPPPSTDTPPAPPPTDTPVVPPPPGPTSTPAPGGGGEGTGFLAELDGFVWQNGDPAAPLGGVAVRYVSDGVAVDATTDPQGHFGFVNVGPDLGTLDLADAQWQSGMGGVIVQPPVGYKLRVNLAALPKGKSLTSKVTLTSNAVSSGQTVTFTLKVLNGTQGVVSGLTLGDQLPDGMSLGSVTTSRGDVVGHSPSAVTVDLNSLAAGDSATVTVVALMTQAGANKAANRATLFYREGPAISTQTVAAASGPTTLPVTGIGLPIVLVVVLAVILLLARRLRVRPAL